MLDSPFLLDNNAFVSYERHHLFAILFFVVFGILLIILSKKYASTKQQFVIGNVYAIILSASVIAWTGIKILLNDFDTKTDLPFHMCNLVALLMPIYSFTRKRIIYEILLFWVFSGTIQAIFTPDVDSGFPHYTYIKYWLVHAGVIVFMLYATFVYGHKPTLKSVFKSFLALQVYVVFMYFVNNMFDSNYFFINKKPDVATLLDLFGDWPYYVLIGELIAIPFFLTIYLPFHLFKSKRVEVD
jgi:hypothetical integral membrane protein (TIGR02206 family)